MNFSLILEPNITKGVGSQQMLRVARQLQETNSGTYIERNICSDPEGEIKIFVSLKYYYLHWHRNS